MTILYIPVLFGAFFFYWWWRLDIRIVAHYKFINTAFKSLFGVLTGYDPSAYGGQPGPGQFPGAQYLNDPMANMAMQYGQSLAGQGTEFVHKNVRFSLLSLWFVLFNMYLLFICIPVFIVIFISDWKICVNISNEVLFCGRYNICFEEAGNVVFPFHPFCKLT